MSVSEVLISDIGSMSCYCVFFLDFLFLKVFFGRRVKVFFWLLVFRLFGVELYIRKACLAIKGASIEAPVTPPYTDGKNPPFRVAAFLSFFTAFFFLVVLLDISIKEKHFERDCNF
jgi:hypothetical protein